MTLDHGTNRYVMNTMQREKSSASGAFGTNKYTPMYTVSQNKLLGQKRSNNLTEYHMINKKRELVPRKKKGGDCGCNGGKLSKSFGILYHGKK